MDLGQRIKVAREALKMTQTDLARAAGVLQPTIAALENGTSKRTNKIYEIAKALRVTVERLMEGDTMPSPTEIQKLEQAMAIAGELRAGLEVVNTCLQRAAHAGLETSVSSFIAQGKGAYTEGRSTTLKQAKTDQWKIEIHVSLPV